MDRERCVNPSTDAYGKMVLESTRNDAVALPEDDGGSTSILVLKEQTILAAIELERARAKLEFDRAPVRKLGEMLAKTSRPEDVGAPFAFVEPGYFQPFRQLYMVKRAAEHPTGGDVSEYMLSAAGKFKTFANVGDCIDQADELVDFCIGLHRVLRDELKAEERIGRQDSRSIDTAAEDSRVTA